MDATLWRVEVSDECVRGFLYYDGLVLATLEPPWRHNVRNVSCIQPGAYNCSYIERSASGKYRQVYSLQNVSERSGILIHSGNVASHTKGCILVGLSWGVLGNNRAVINSKSALAELNEATGRSGFKLNIIGGIYA